MKYLAIDTSGLYGAVGLLDESEVIAELGLRSKENFSGQLVPAIEALLNNISVQSADIDVYGVVIGPGSFTGLRVALATLKAFAWTFQKPLVGLSSLEVLANNLPHQSGLIAPMLDAKKKRIYGAIYEWRNENLIEHIPPSDVTALELISHVSEPITVFGSGARLYRPEIEALENQNIRFAELSADAPRGGILARLTKSAFERGERLDPILSEPHYIRPTEAEVSEKRVMS